MIDERNLLDRMNEIACFSPLCCAVLNAPVVVCAMPSGDFHCSRLCSILKLMLT